MGVVVAALAVKEDAGAEAEEEEAPKAKPPLVVAADAGVLAAVAAPNMPPCRAPTHACQHSRGRDKHPLRVAGCAEYIYIYIYIYI